MNCFQYLPLPILTLRFPLLIYQVTAVSRGVNYRLHLFLIKLLYIVLSCLSLLRISSLLTLRLHVIVRSLHQQTPEYLVPTISIKLSQKQCGISCESLLRWFPFAFCGSTAFRSDFSLHEQEGVGRLPTHPPSEEAVGREELLISGATRLSETRLRRNRVWRWH